MSDTTQGDDNVQDAENTAANIEAAEVANDAESRAARLVAEARRKQEEAPAPKQYAYNVESPTLSAIIAAPFVAATGAFGLVLGTAAAIIALPVLIPFAAGAMIFKGVQKIVDPMADARRRKAGERAIEDAKLQKELTEIKGNDVEDEPEAEAEPEADPRNEREIAPGIYQYEPQEEDYDRVGGKLSDFTLQQGGPDYEPASFAFKAVSRDGHVMGEVVGSTIWGHTKVELLHVESIHRGHGVGTKLLNLAEEFAKNAHNSRGVELWTPTFQGEGFYETAGYEAQARFPMDTAGRFDGAPQEHIIYYKSLEPDLLKAAEEGDYKTIADYAYKYPERVSAKLDDLAAADPMLCVNLTPFFSQVKDGTYVLSLDDIKSRLELHALPKKASVEFSRAMKRHSANMEAKLNDVLAEAQKSIADAADRAAKALEEAEQAPRKPMNPADLNSSHFNLDF